MFHANNADIIDSGNIVVWANDSDVAVILICNVHDMDSDVWYDSGHNYSNSREFISIKKLVMFKMFLHYWVYMLSLEMITHLLFGKGKVKPMQMAIKKIKIYQCI